jgi:prolyl 4-hydroxylase
MHLDTGIYYNIKTKEKATHTFLIYLNEDFVGGETEFFSEEFISKKIYKPIQGYGLVFDLKLWHTGKPVIEGKKYLLHMELIGELIT